VLSGVTAAVIGVEHDRRITIVNTSAEDLLTLKSDELIGKNLSDISPEVDQVVTEATTRHRSDFRKQISLVRGGTVRTLSVQVTREESRDANESYV
ncbi:PAS domain-containing sensor histidine kinase, partial [Bacillus cereus]